MRRGRHGMERGDEEKKIPGWNVLVNVDACLQKHSIGLIVWALHFCAVLFNAHPMLMC